MTTQTRSLHEDGDPLASALSSAVHGLRAPDLGPDLAAIQRRGRRRRWARRAAVATPAALLAGTAVLGMTHIAPTNHDLRVVPAASTGVLDHDQVVQALDRAVAGAIPGKHITAVSALPRDDGQTAAWTASLSDRSTKPHTELLLQVVPGPLSPGEPLTGCDGENVSGCTEVGLADGSRLITGTVGPGTSTPGTGGDQENPQPPLLRPAGRAVRHPGHRQRGHGHRDRNHRRRRRRANPAARPPPRRVSLHPREPASHRG